VHRTEINSPSWKKQENPLRNRHRKADPENSTNVLVVDDDPDTDRFILEVLAHKGIHGSLVDNKKAALDFIDNNSCDLVLIGEKISLGSDPSDQPLAAAKRYGEAGRGGFELLSKIKANLPEVPVIIMAEVGDPKAQNQPAEGGLNPVQGSALAAEGGLDPVQSFPPCVWRTEGEHTLLRLATQAAIKAIRLGCYDFLIKPLNRQRVETLLDTLLPNHSVSTAASARDGTRCLYQIIGKSPKLLQTIELAERIAPTSAPVLISGQSGTGKELISYLIHQKSKRVHGPYIKVNCVALSDSLLESELFGHEKGAFTGAYTQRKGRFEMAHGGTLLLDEITETPLRFQAKLLRILEQQEFERVGGNENIRVNVRIISTTNKDLLEEVQQGRFRQDLYYRLSGVRLVIAPLSQRREDLPELVWHFVNLYTRQTQRRITKLDPSMMDIFAKYHWPGNVRQLRNVVLTSLILGAGETLSLADVSWLFDELQPLPQEGPAMDNGRPLSFISRPPYYGLGGVPLEQVERQAILETLRQTAGNQTKAAKVLGISDRTLRDKVRRYRSACGGPQTDAKPSTNCPPASPAWQGVEGAGSLAISAGQPV
jgi:two-component system response regulator HydG